jgi:DNA replication and repair protein RecF
VFIEKIELRNFRNHQNTVAEFFNGINILVGQNAQGKTNLLESIYLSCVGRGWKAVKDAEMIMFGEAGASVKTVTQKKFGDISVSVKLGNGTKKAISINNVPISKIGELMGTVNCVFFSPDELRLIKEAPADRRRFLNIDISQIDKSYFYALIRYNKILAQRNAYLKNLPYPVTDDDLRGLEIWDTQLVSAGEILIKKRIEFIDKLKPYLIEAHSNLTDGAEKIDFEYESCGDVDFAARLKAARDKDMRLKTTTVGPHRDDIKIEINGQDVRTYGSQGQQRTAALSIKIAELRLFADITGETPILLLDDVFSELDSSRQSRLLISIKDAQAIISTTDVPASLRKNDIKIFNIQNGQVTEVQARGK